MQATEEVEFPEVAEASVVVELEIRAAFEFPLLEKFPFWKIEEKKELALSRPRNHLRNPK